MYKVVRRFHDLQDGKKTKEGTVYREYRIGDSYPRKGLKPSKERIAELMSADNKQGMPLIRPAEEETAALTEKVSE